jgi:hypothetical protein
MRSMTTLVGMEVSEYFSWPILMRVFCAVSRMGLSPSKRTHELGARQEGHDGALADSSIADHDDGLGVLLVDWNRLDTSVDEGLQFVQVNGVALFVHGGLLDA